MLVRSSGESGEPPKPKATVDFVTHPILLRIDLTQAHANESMAKVVVGIGAFAGGVEALTTFFDHDYGTTVLSLNLHIPRLQKQEEEINA